MALTRAYPPRSYRLEWCGHCATAPVLPGSETPSRSEAPGTTVPAELPAVIGTSLQASDRKLRQPSSRHLAFAHCPLALSDTARLGTSAVCQRCYNQPEAQSLMAIRRLPLDTQPAVTAPTVSRTRDDLLLYLAMLLVLESVYGWSLFVSPDLRAPARLIPFTGLLLVHAALHLIGPRLSPQTGRGLTRGGDSGRVRARDVATPPGQRGRCQVAILH